MAHGEWGKSPDCPGHAPMDESQHACPLRAYAHGFKSDKLEAQGAVLNKLMKSGVKSGVGND